MPEFFTAGFVLAGGRSSRMGLDKAGLKWNGESLLERAVRVLGSVTGSVTIVGEPEIHRVKDVLVISDQIQNAGPLGGIEAALAWSRAPWNLIVACDMPSLDSVVMRAILQRATEQSECDAVIPVCDGMPQPLCAAYHRHALPAVCAALAAGTFKIMEALKPVRVCLMEMASAGAFRNVNTPGDWKTLISEKSA